MLKLDKKIIFLNSLIAILLSFDSLGYFGIFAISILLIAFNLISYKYAIYTLLLASIAAYFAGYENINMSSQLIIGPLILVSISKWFSFRNKFNLLIIIPILSIYIHSFLFSNNFLFSVLKFSILVSVILLLYELLSKFFYSDERRDLSTLFEFLNFLFVSLIQFILFGSLIRFITLGMNSLFSVDGYLSLCIRGPIALSVIISFLLYLKILISIISQKKFISLPEWFLIAIAFLTNARGPILAIGLTYIFSFGIYRIIKKNIFSLFLLGIFTLLNPTIFSSFILKNYSDGFLSIFKLYELSRGALIINQFTNFIENPFTGTGFGIQLTGIIGEFSFPWVQKFTYLGPLPVSAPVEKAVLPLVLLEEFGIFLTIFLFFILIIYLLKKKALRKIRINQEITSKLSQISFASLLYYFLLSLTELVHFSIFGLGIPLSFSLMLSLLIFNKNQDLKIKESIN